jgi:hypothetical protein
MTWRWKTNREGEAKIMKQRVRPLLLLAACLLVLGVLVFGAACGGSDDTATTLAATVTTAAASTDTTAAAGVSGTVEVKGLVDSPKTMTVADLQALGVTTITAEHPKKGSTEYTGVLVSKIMEAVGVQSGATVLDMTATDAFMGEVVLAEMDPNSMIAIGEDGKLNAVMPGQTGKAWVTDVITLTFN